MIIPPNGPRILVGVGVLQKDRFVTREQFWQRLPNSYSLASSEEKVVNYTQTQGIQESSSDSKTVTDSVSVSASAGWGPFSASVSASLSESSTSAQQLTVSTQTTSYVSSTYQNLGENAELNLLWQLTDVVTVYDADGRPLASVISGEAPPVISGPWDVKEIEGPDKRELKRKKRDHPLTT